MNRQIALKKQLNGAATTTVYSSPDIVDAVTYVFKNQTSIPRLGTCSNVNCHFEKTTPTWGSPLFSYTSATTNDCDKCHGAPPAGTVAAPGAAGTHAKHDTFYPGVANCVKCHADHLAETAKFAHASSVGNRNLIVALKDPANLTGGAYSGALNDYLPSQANTFGACSNIYCHSNAQGINGTGAVTYRQPVWGSSPMTCGSCHQDMAAFANVSSGNHRAHAQSAGYTCDVCHGIGYGNSTVPAGPGSTHVNKLINLTFMGTAAGTAYGKGTAGFAPGTAYSTCSTSKCHGQGTPTWGKSLYSTTSTCDKCHGSLTSSPFYSTSYPIQVTSPTDLQVGAHFVHLSSSTKKISSSVHCRDCHSVPATVTSAGHMNGSADPVFPSGSLANGPTGALQATYSTATNSCGTTYCHGGSLASNKAATGATLAALNLHPRWNDSSYLSATVATSPTPADCGKCHGFPPQSVGHTSYTTKPLTSTVGSNCNGCHKHLDADAHFIDKSLHINGKIEGGDCIGCHLGTQPVTTAKRAAAASLFNAQSHHVQGTKLDVTHCAQCHWEANADGTINPAYHDQVTGKPVDLVIWTGTGRPAGTAYVEGVTGTAYTANGSRTEIAKVNKHCLGCHNDTNKNNAGIFAGDSNAPSSYAWENSTKTSIAARYNQGTAATKWGKYSTSNTNRKSQVSKAFSPHGSGAAVNEQGWSPTGGVDGVNTTGVAVAKVNTTGTASVYCYDCHNSHGSAANGITSSYSSATGRYKGGLVKTTTSGLGGYNVTYAPTQGGTDSVRTGTLYNPGAALCFDCHIKQQNSGAPWGYNTYGGTAPVLGYWDTPYFGNYTTFPSTRYTRYPYKASTGSASLGRARDMGQNYGGHFGKYSTMSTAPKNDINHLCTPCHDPHGVSPTLGGNQQFAVPLLKGTWITSPYREDTAPATTNEKRGGGSKQAVLAGGSNPVYQIDQNTFQADRATVNQATDANYVFGGFTSNATAYKASTYQTYTSGTFAGLCLRCHSKSSLNNADPASTSNWKSMTRVHNSVAGWASTGGLNASNAVHAYTCSKCHAPHNSRLPRLLVTNCLNYQHRGRVASTGYISSTRGSNATTNSGNMISTAYSTGQGAGRFPSGGARYVGTQLIALTGETAKYPGPWVWGKAQLGSPERSYGTNCHSTSTAGGAPSGTSIQPLNQRWNNVSPW